MTPAVRRLRRPTTYALLAGGGQTVVLWFWHLPGPYVAAVDRPAVHAAEHLSLLATAWLFWVPVLGSPRHRAPAPGDGAAAGRRHAARLGARRGAHLRPRSRSIPAGCSAPIRWPTSNWPAC
ncbi:cytochrome c oxidase assembly protein [Micromonospora sp. ATA32]|nr:cytochrome c oxidase assembly protein [Micromonospora sp. ATA32]